MIGVTASDRGQLRITHTRQRRKAVTRCTTPGNPPCRGNFSPYEQNAKVAPGQE